MMKKFTVILAVLAIVCLSSMAFAADVTVGGSFDIRSRDFKDLALNKNGASSGDVVDTQERVRLEVNAKAGDVKGKITVENDWDTWGRFEQPQGDNTTKTSDFKGDNAKLDLREAWINFNLPGVPVNVTAGHQLLQLGNGWFFRSMKYGSDAWVVANVSGNNTLAFVDVKISEGLSQANNDDVDAYVLLDVLKLDENMAVGIDITMANDRSNALGFNTANGPGLGYNTEAQNIGLSFNGKTGPVALKAELDLQMGKAKGTAGPGDRKFKGNQIVVQGTVPTDAMAVNFTLARGTGNKAGDADIKEMATLLDADQHYTLLYEYKIGNKGCIDGPNTDGKHAGFCNTTALSAGVMANASKSVAVGADLWFLQSTEKSLTNNKSDLGTEIDVKVNWKLYDNLSWNWQLAYFKPGDALKTAAGTTDAATGIQGVLSMKF